MTGPEYAAIAGVIFLAAESVLGACLVAVLSRVGLAWVVVAVVLTGLGACRQGVVGTPAGQGLQS